MQLSELLLNRFLYKSEQETTTQDSSLMASNVGSTVGGSSSEAGTEAGKDAKNVLTGTVIQSCIIQTSGGIKRVELIPTFTIAPGFPGAGHYLDSLVAWNAGNIPAVIIDGDGLYTIAANVVASNIGILNVLNYFNYLGVRQPQVFTGSVDNTGVAISLPVGWTSAKTATGKYTITHNLNNINCIENITSITGHYRCYIYNQTADDFSVSWEESDYTVGGLYNGEKAVDVGFYFSLFNNLP